MKGKQRQWIWALILLGLSHPAFAHGDGCISYGTFCVCYFNSLSQQPEKEMQFYCNSKATAAVQMRNHNLMCRGFIYGSEIGAGTFSMIGPETKKMLDTYYFTVKADSNRSGERFISIISAGHIDCHLGRGGHPYEMTGAWG